MWMVSETYFPSVILFEWSSVSSGIRLRESIVRHLHNQIYDFADNLFRHIEKNIYIHFLFAFTSSWMWAVAALCCPSEYTGHMLHI